MRRTPYLPSLMLCLILLVAGGSSEIGGPLSLERAEAGKRCQGAKKSPKQLKVKEAQRLVVCLVNKRRSKRGLHRLKRDSKVSRAATDHTRYMQKRDCFAHDCPGELSLTGRLTRANYLPCNCRWGVAENIAWGKGSGSASPAAVVKGWMGSATHRAAILSSHEHIGVGFRRGSPFSNSHEYGTYTLDFGYKR